MTRHLSLNNIEYDDHSDASSMYSDMYSDTSSIGHFHNASGAASVFSRKSLDTVQESRSLAFVGSHGGGNSVKSELRAAKRQAAQQQAAKLKMDLLSFADVPN